jgi:hypothetical protein
LLEHPCAIAWKPVYSAATTPAPWLRAQLPIDSKRSLIAKALVDFASPDQCAPSARESACGLTQVSSSFPPLWLHPGRQFAHPAEQRYTSLIGNIEPHFHELTASLRLRKSAASVVVDVQMPSTSRCHSYEQLARLLDCLSAHLRGNSEVSWCELTASLLCGKPPACDVLDVDVSSIPASDPSSIEVPDDAASRLVLRMEVRTRYPWLATDGLPWFVCLMLESSSTGLTFEVVEQTHLCTPSRALILRHGELSHSHSVRHRSNRTVAQLDENKPPEVQQRPGQYVGASRTEVSRTTTTR